MEEDDNDFLMHIGRDYQAHIPDLNCEETYSRLNENAICTWIPPQNINTFEQVEKYLKIARFEYGFTIDQALAILHWFSLDFKRSYEELKNWMPQNDGWTHFDKLYFEQAYKSCGKNFRMIQHLVPNKSIGDLVSYYYMRKKLKTAQSDMDLKSKYILNQNIHSKRENVQNHAKILMSLSCQNIKFCSHSNSIVNCNKQFVYETPELWHDSYTLNGQPVNLFDYLPIDLKYFSLLKTHMKISKNCNKIEVIESNTQPSLIDQSQNLKDNTLNEIKLNMNNNAFPPHESQSDQLVDLILKNLDAEIYELKFRERENTQIISKIMANLPKPLLSLVTLENVLSCHHIVSEKTVKHEIVYL